MLLESDSTLCNSLDPLSGIAEHRRTTNTGTMAGQACAVVNLRAGHCGRDRLRFSRGLNGRQRRLEFIVGAVDLTDRTNSLGDGVLVFSGIARVDTLREIRHLHGQHKNRQRDRGEYADNEGIRIKKFLIPTQLTAPENGKIDSSCFMPDGGGRLYIISPPGSVPDIVAGRYFANYGMIHGTTCRVITRKNDKSETSLNIKKNHDLGRAEARKRVDAIADSLSSKYGLSSSWEGDALKFSGSGVNGRIDVSDQSIDVDVTLGFALMMLEGAIRTSIEEAMDTHLA